MIMLEIIESIIQVEFIYKWQTLIGSALGPFLAIMLSVIVFFIKGELQKRKDRKESIRVAEIAFSQTFNHITSLIDEVEGFVERVKTIIGEIETITDPKQYALPETNYPPIINIHFDENLPKMKF